MDILIDYHLVFIVIVFVLLILTILFLFVADRTYEIIVAGLLFAGINYILCLICSISFFRIGLVGYTGAGESVITEFPDMQTFYVIFFSLHLLNVALIFYAAMLLARKPWEDFEKEKTI